MPRPRQPRPHTKRHGVLEGQHRRRTSGNTKLGWYVNLPGSSEQIVFNPQLLGSAFVVNSAVPGSQLDALVHHEYGHGLHLCAVRS